jgi:4-hydroxy-tetrahydrodipicolinate synthase
MPAGTTGEGLLLHEAEVAELIRAAVEAAEGRIDVIAHVGRIGTRATVDLVDAARDIGATGVSAVVPPYFPLQEDQVIAHYRALLRRNVPVYAYTIPARTVNDVSASAARVLAREGLAGVKDSTKSMPRHLEFLEVAREEPPFEVFMGSDEMVLGSIDAGGSGCVSAVANARPDVLVAIRDACREGARDRAEHAQKELSRIRATLSTGPTLRALKAATMEALAKLRIPYPTALRPPLG